MLRRPVLGQGVNDTRQNRMFDLEFLQGRQKFVNRGDGES